MKITFCGANHEVTGSQTLIEWQSGRYAMVDCGMEQGKNEYVNAPLPVKADQVEHVFVTHAHIDHTGMLPLLYKQGFRGRVYATRATCNLLHIMLADSAHIQESDAEYQNKKNKRAGKPLVEPLYTQDDVTGLLENIRPCEYGEQIMVDEGIIVRFTDAGHLLGSASVELWLKDGDTQKKIVFSGDVGNVDKPILNDPMPIDEADYIVVESTYGNRFHDKRIDPLPMLVDVLQRTLDRGGNVVIPSFAVGRTQEVLYLIREVKQRGLVHGHDGFPVYVDSPLANEATAIFLQADTSFFDEPTRAVMQEGVNPIAFDGLRTSITADDSKRLNADTVPKVIISSSGMCDAGRIRHHLKYNLWRPESTVLFTGYQSNGTLGRLIQDGAESVKLFCDEIAVKCEIATWQGVSGHADKNGLMKWVRNITPTPGQIFVNHGDHDAAMEFAQSLKDEFHVNVDVPYSGSVYDLAKGVWEYEAEPVNFAKKKTQDAEKADRAFSNLLDAARRLLDVVQGARGMANKELQRFTDKINSLINDIRN